MYIVYKYTYWKASSKFSNSVVRLNSVEHLSSAAGLQVRWGFLAHRAVRSAE